MQPTDATRVLAALANESRLLVLDWLREPERHFPPQRDGDFEKDGVCSVFLADKLGVTAPTTSRHMKVLVDAGLVRAKRKKGWTFYRRDEAGLKAAQRLIAASLGLGKRLSA
jgi:DNA-binding transcriptional ArsR family regulator